MYVGRDFREYLAYTSILSELGFSFPWEDTWNVGHQFEYGFSLILWILSKLFVNKTIIYSVVYGVFLAFCYVGCWLTGKIREDSLFETKPFSSQRQGLDRKNQNYAWVGFAVVLFAWEIVAFNALRQMLAVSVLLCCIPCFLQRRYIWAGILFAIALSFHTTVIYAAPWVLFVGKKSNEPIRIVGIICFYLIVVAGMPFLANYFGYGGYMWGEGGSVNGAVLLLPLLFFIGWLPRNRLFLFGYKELLVLLYTSGIAILAPYMNRLYYYPETIVVIMAISLSHLKDWRRPLLWGWLFLYVVGYRFLYAHVWGRDLFYFEWVK